MKRKSKNDAILREIANAGWDVSERANIYDEPLRLDHMIKINERMTALGYDEHSTRDSKWIEDLLRIAMELNNA